MKSAFAVVLLAGVLHAQAFSHSCDAAVFGNPSDLLSTAQSSRVVDAAHQLDGKGADVRVIADDTVGMTPEQYVGSLQKACPSWQSAGGGVKNNLIVFLVFPKRHKVGLFIGNEFEKAINTSMIRSQFMAPGFRDGDYARGFISGINEAGVQIEAFQTAALHPGTTVVSQQATDYSGLWKWLDALLILAALIGCWGIFVYYRNKRRDVRDAQQAAVQARNEAAAMVTANPTAYEAEVFSQASSSETYNPDTNGLSAGQYIRIANKYNAITASLKVPKVQPRRGRQTHPSDPVSKQSAAPPPTSPSPTSTPVQQSTTVEHHHTTISVDDLEDKMRRRIERDYSPGYIPVPVVVEEPYIAPSSAPEPSYRAPSSGWSDSSSSSSYDSGGSSGFSDSSSSSDFGGGGGDFGGGSSDF